MSSPYHFTGQVLKDYNEMLKACAWFDPTKHFLVVLSDDSGNHYHLVGIGKDMDNVRPVLEYGLMQAKSRKWRNMGLMVDLLLNGRCHSWTL